MLTIERNYTFGEENITNFSFTICNVTYVYLNIYLFIWESVSLLIYFHGSFILTPDTAFSTPITATLRITSTASFSACLTPSSSEGEKLVRT
mmetsp:Transcript_1966/g.2929  ORF Transcript_1966/g.2929 Transcript_1966/m.2929 type:complete len:92 (+) Transcript_1966:364-639(+)